MTLIDVREHDELATTGKAAGAIHIPLGQITSAANPTNSDLHADLFTNKPVAVYCASGGRSGMAVNALLEMGYEFVLNIGGFDQWVQAGGPVDSA